MQDPAWPGAHAAHGWPLRLLWQAKCAGSLQVARAERARPVGRQVRKHVGGLGSWRAVRCGALALGSPLGSACRPGLARHGGCPQLHRSGRCGDLPLELVRRLGVPLLRAAGAVRGQAWEDAGPEVWPQGPDLGLEEQAAPAEPELIWAAAWPGAAVAGRLSCRRLTAQ